MIVRNAPSTFQILLGQMLKYSPRSAKAIGFLKKSRNDFEIFVEDTSKISEWLAVIKTCTPDGVRINSVTALGGREDVLKACRLDQVDDGRKRLYIIDADFDFVLGIRKPNLRNLYRIRAYCLENTFLSKDLVRRLISDMAPTVDADTKAEQCDDYLTKVWGPLLRRLFAFYAAHCAIRGGCLTCGFHVARLQIPGSSPYMPDLQKILHKAKEVFVEINSKGGVGKANLLQCKRQSMRLPLGKVVTGKTYLLPLLSDWLKREISINLSIEHLALLLVSRASYPLDKGLARRLSMMTS